MKVERFKFPKDLEWMAGRLVFDRPESLGSTMAKRDIVTSEAEHDALTRAHVLSTLARRAMTDAQVSAEIEIFNAMDQQQPPLSQ